MLLVGNWTTTVLQQGSTDQEHNDPCSPRMCPHFRGIISLMKLKVYTPKKLILIPDVTTNLCPYNFGKGSKINLIVILQHKFVQQNVVTSCSPFMLPESLSLKNEAAP